MVRVTVSRLNRSTQHPRNAYQTLA